MGAFLKKVFKSDITTNFIKNLFSYGLPVAMLQFIVQPLIAERLGAEENGLFLTIIALNYLLVSLTAGIMMQTRLLQNEKYQQNRYVGDYSIFMAVVIGVISLAMSIGCSLYMGKISPVDIVLCVILSTLFAAHDYINVQYRVELNYSKILISNLVLCGGYLVGLGVFWFVLPQWQVVYIVAYGITEIYDFCNTSYWREPLKKTPLFGETLKRYFVLAGASALSYVVSYGDRLLLYPLLDGTSVSILSSAEIVGKLLMLLSTPLSGFMLSYVVREEKIVIRGKYVLILLAAMAVAFVGCCGISIPLLKILYPQWAEQSIPYVPFVTLTSIVNLFSHLANVLVIRFCSSKWQICINGAYLASYLVCSFVLLKLFALYGFCIGTLIASLVKLGVIVLIWCKGKKTFDKQ